MEWIKNIISKFLAMLGFSSTTKDDLSLMTLKVGDTLDYKSNTWTVMKIAEVSYVDGSVDEDDEVAESNVIEYQLKNMSGDYLYLEIEDDDEIWYTMSKKVNEDYEVITQSQLLKFQGDVENDIAPEFPEVLMYNDKRFEQESSGRGNHNGDPFFHWSYETDDLAHKNKDEEISICEFENNVFEVTYCVEIFEEELTNLKRKEK